MRLNLDRRLTCVAGMCGETRVLADIGCDHGRLGCYMLQNGKCERALFCDISEPSLAKAAVLAKKMALTDRSGFYVSDGFKSIPEPFTLAVIAGMGGEVMAGILRGAGLKGEAVVLSPNIDPQYVRRAVMDSGYRITREELVRDAGRLYPVMRAEKGRKEMTAIELEAGPCLMERPGSELKEYAAFRVRVLERALDGARRGGDDEKAAMLEETLRVWKESGL